MARRIDIELTSRRDDDTWTWRAPGARQPKGTVDAAIVPEGAKVGDVLRADAEFDLEGITVTAVAAPRGDQAAGTDPNRIEVIGPKAPESGVSVVLAQGRRRRRDEGERRQRRSERPADATAERPRGRRSEERARTSADGRPDTRSAARRGTAGRPERARGDRTERAGRGERPRRLQPSTEHRNAALAALRPEQLPVAEQLLRGGVPAVRQAIEEQNTRARSEGRPEVTPEPLLAMAEELLPAMNLATWKDRAVAARAAGRDAPLREIRSIVAASSTVALDEGGRELAGALRQSLDERITALREAWLGRITSALDAGRILDALAASARAPEPAARLPAELAVRLATAAGEAMTADIDPPSWLELLRAVVASPVRRTVRPAALPAEAGDDLRAEARRAAGLVPEVARLLGLPIPPPPGPRRPARQPGGARRG